MSERWQSVCSFPGLSQHGDCIPWLVLHLTQQGLMSVCACACVHVYPSGESEADFCVKTERTDVVTKCILTLSYTEMKDKDLSKCKS